MPAYYAAIILLGRFRVKQAVPVIVEALEDPDECPPDLASFAIVALERIGDPSVVAAIKPYLTMSESTTMDNENESFEQKWGVRTNAARALAALGDRSGVPVLMSLLDADQSLLRDYAQGLLEDITGHHLGADRRHRQPPETP